MAVIEGDPRRSDLSAEHLEASAEALTELAREVSSSARPTPGLTPLFVDLVHYEHGFFLSSMLQGFPMLPSAGGFVEIPEPATAPDIPEGFAHDVLTDWAGPEEIEGLLSRRGSALLNPRGATSDLPFTWATVAGQPVAAQIRSVLESLSSVLARQSVSRDSLTNLGNALPDQLESIEADLARVTTGILDSVNRSGWRVAARELRLRSERSGRPLRVRYRATVFDASALAERAPLLRETYNRLTPVREAVDRTASGMARALYISGEGPTDVLRTLNDQFEHLGMRQFLAHAVRDSFVCGNGVMVLTDVLGGAMRLVAPEALVAVRGDTATVHGTYGDEQLSPVLHLPGGRQIGSELGISFLEPFVMTCANRDTFLSVLLSAEVMLATTVTNDDARAWADAMKPYAQERLRQLSARTREVLGHATEQFVDAAPGTYFEGQERMTPTAGRVVLVESLDEVVAYRSN